ncbi:MAG: purine-nucleoside phosphorylase [Butyrivibrio sp.]|nr:purine-nucleoside phosphorylase [Butyrivibrio sp.]
MGNAIYEKLQNCYKAVREKTDFVPEIALVLGSGLGNYAENIKIETEVDYKDIPGFPVSTVPGHAGKFIFGYVGDKKVVCMKGRVHFYEGYEVSDVVLPARLMHMLGAKILFLTNAAGGLGDGFKPGDFMLIKDHFSLFAPNPLIGPNIDELGVRFPDMSDVYKKDLADTIREAAESLNINLREGVYAQLTGPSFESPTEIRILKQLGVSAVGMSTVIEAIAGNHMGMKVCGISFISNVAAGLSDNPLSHEEVQEAADLAAEKFSKLVTETIKRF